MLSAGCGREVEVVRSPAPPPSAPTRILPSKPVAEVAKNPDASPKPPVPEPAPPPNPQAPKPPVPPSIDTPPAPPKAAPPREPELGPVAGTANDPAVSTAGYTIRTMDHVKADVFLNGHKHATTPNLWSLTLNTPFDPKVAVDDWPPPGAASVGSAKRTDEDGRYVSSVELWIAGGKHDGEAFKDYLRRYPHLADGEHLLFVWADLQGKKRTGALRVRVVDSGGALYRWVNYLPPVVNEESDAARLFKRALWFERD